MKLTATQRQALTNARDFGNAWYYRKPQVGGCSIPGSVQRVQMHRKLVAAGLLDQDDKITEAGRAALA